MPTPTALDPTRATPAALHAMMTTLQALARQFTPALTDTDHLAWRSVCVALEAAIYVGMRQFGATEFDEEDCARAACVAAAGCDGPVRTGRAVAGQATAMLAWAAAHDISG